VTFAVVPFKDLEAAKERLSSRLGPLERRALALAMLDDVLGALSRVPALEGVLVVTCEPEVMRRAARFGAEILEEPVNEGHTAAVQRAVRELERRRASAMLCVSGDLPSVTPAEIAALLRALGPPPSVVLAPSRDDRGTNAVVVSPPGAMPLRFGEPSFPAHLARARELGLRTEVMRLSGTALDLDTPDDLDFFLRTRSETATYGLLRGPRDR
jgi:2-phospho-L-lactate guanylyltransferase